MLMERMAASKAQAEEDAANAPAKQAAGRAEKSTLDTILTSSVGRQVGRTAASMITRTLLGVLGFGASRSSRKKSSWF
jgi:hypothetical protein